MMESDKDGISCSAHWRKKVVWASVIGWVGERGEAFEGLVRGERRREEERDLLERRSAILITNIPTLPSSEEATTSSDI
jgi:hypothetical protein